MTPVSRVQPKPIGTLAGVKEKRMLPAALGSASVTLKCMHVPAAAAPLPATCGTLPLLPTQPAPYDLKLPKPGQPCSTNAALIDAKCGVPSNNDPLSSSSASQWSRMT